MAAKKAIKNVLTPLEALGNQLREYRVALDRSGQRLVTPLNESGITLDPPTVKTRNISPGISRVWATMFARVGGSLYPLVSDAIGRLLVTDKREDEYTTSWVTIPLLAAAWTVHSFGLLVNQVEIMIPGEFGRIQFSKNGTDWNGDTHSFVGSFPTVGGASSRSWNVTCTHCRIMLLSTPGVGTAYIVGKTLLP